MKKLMIGLAIAAVAVPALSITAAQANYLSPRAGGPMVVDETAYGYGPRAGMHAYAYAPGPAYGADSYAYGVDTATPQVLGSHPVFVNGIYQGADPDPFIRSQLLRDPPNPGQ